MTKLLNLARAVLLLLVAVVFVCVAAPTFGCSRPGTTTLLESWSANIIVTINNLNVPTGPDGTATANWNSGLIGAAGCTPIFETGGGNITMTYAPIAQTCSTSSTGVQSCTATRGVTHFESATFTPGGRLSSVPITINSSVTTTAAITEVIAHEFGHTFGLADCNYPACPVGSSVMETGAPTTSINSTIGQPGPTSCDITAVLGFNADYVCPPSSGGGSPCCTPCVQMRQQPPGNLRGGGKFLNVSNYCCTCSPILLDTTGLGFNLTSAADGVVFDLTGTGNPIKMAWTASGSQNAFLALPGADGLVHNGQQLFGNFTPQPPCPTGDTTCSRNGFRALAVYDDPKNGGNGDGIIDSHDAIFSSLRLWIDANHDGISQPEELHTLPSLGINSISLAYKASEKTDQYGNVFRYRAQVNPGNPTDAGKTAYDIFFTALDDPTTTARSCPAPPATGKRPASSIRKH